LIAEYAVLDAFFSVPTFLAGSLAARLARERDYATMYGFYFFAGAIWRLADTLITNRKFTTLEY
jgi:hypothetical protein